MSKISIIIPFYNTEKYIEKCLNSLLDQNVDDFQVIMVNDGSTDSSKTIADRFACNDSRFLLLEKENGGQSAARNLALQYTDGKYILFLDSDDYLEKNVLYQIYNVMEEKSLDILRPLIIQETNGVFSLSEKYIDDNIVVSGCEKLKKNDITFSLCNHIYRSDFLKENNLQFLEGLSHEDMAFVPETMYYAERMMDTNLPFYYYVRRPESTTNYITLKKIDEYFQVAREMKLFIDSKVDAEMCISFFDDYLCFLFTHVINMCVTSGINIGQYLSDDKQADIISSLKRSKSIKQKFILFLIRNKLFFIIKVLYFFSEKKNRLIKLYG